MRDKIRWLLAFAVVLVIGYLVWVATDGGVQEVKKADLPGPVTCDSYGSGGEHCKDGNGKWYICDRTGECEEDVDPAA